MEVDTVANPAASEVSVSVGILSLSDEVVIEQDGDYKIEDEKYLPIECQKVLGFGHSGVVQRVEHKQTKELFAKKVINFPRKGKGREQAEERYHNEAAIIRSLRTHTHVIRLFASFTTPGSGGLLLQPAADEGDLHDYLDRFADLVEKPANSSTNLEAMTRVLEQAFGCLSSGLVYMHKRGIRHKDIKPRNILIHQERPIYHWGRKAESSASDIRSRTDSAIEPQMPEPAPQDVRTLQGFISGTPQTGWYDRLDTSYRMRTSHEAREFFKVGKVFAMLYTETASDDSVSISNDEAYTVVRFGQSAYTNIRPFVVVDVRRGFVNACGIGTYSGRGTLKEGCNPAEHTMVYLSGTDPASCYIPGEYESGMTKEPIEVVPAEPSVSIRKESRIRFGKVYPIEMNVAVKDIGRVREDQISALLSYWQQENHTPPLAYPPSSSTAFSSNNWSSGGFSSQHV
ncbi:hypothetical protein J4E86_006772 [Alternaria arbusti]|uniref:uncharacterized protein n=1 Tax=Alternaria arbusti TaxID=232088 RepID=UPI00221EA9D7|nr:uncharacterized protein J4E86_006772 [Alternaria arbusti]KAI4953231.1 hypothetical protein J4E86_006772 [Alternaria arbusti]